MATSVAIVSGIGAIQSILFALLIFIKKERNKSDWILMIWFLVFSIHLSLKLSIGFYEVTVIDILIMTISFLHGPLFLFYSNSILGGHFTKKSLLHFVPFLFFFIGCFYVEDIHEPNWEVILLIVKLISLIFYPSFILYHFKSKIRFLKSKTSNSSVLEYFWIKTAAIIFLISMGVSMIRLVTELNVGVSYFEFIDVLRYTVLVMIIGFYGLKYGTIYKPEEVSEHLSSNKGKYKHSPLKTNEINNIRRLINQYFKENKSYLNSDFSLTKLSRSIDIRKHHLSQVINAEMKTTFYDLVNTKRIEYAAHKIREGESSYLTMEGLGYDCGFNSKSVFFYHFKKQTGKTPGQYKKEMSTN
ncbi:AraC family transcriptional regulator [uncultured Aquimarina sp.]|uniref:helix-turn-helix domain-containing protein n=1 Tax=uncultured Aquimarina sp. TaxID=575652 RepID=UPI00261104FE|nr:AraC family transcriptional regulator [uncultured Aquimarina sp.]